MHTFYFSRPILYTEVARKRRPKRNLDTYCCSFVNEFQSEVSGPKVSVDRQDSLTSTEVRPEDPVGERNHNSDAHPGPTPTFPRQPVPVPYGRTRSFSPLHTGKVTPVGLVGLRDFCPSVDGSVKCFVRIHLLPSPLEIKKRPTQCT